MASPLLSVRGVKTYYGNIAALRGISGILQGYHPGFFHAYIRPAEGTGEVDARHNRE